MKLQNAYTLRLIRLFALLIFVFGSLCAVAQPTAAFNATPTSGCAPLVVSFTDQSTGGPTAWSWDLGNGTISTQQNPTTTYFNSGFFTITLTVTNATGSNTLTRTQYIKVDDRPTTNFSATNTSGCFPLRVNFTDLSTGGTAAITSWEWDFGDGSLSTLQNPLHIYTTAGNYTVTLKTTNAGGCSRVISRPNFIQVSPGVVVNFNNTTPTQCKPPETISFTSTSIGPGVLSHEWLFGDGGTSFLQNPNHTYNSGGSFTVSLIVQSSLGCVDTLIRPASVVIRDVLSDFTYTPSVCQNATASFNNISVPASLNSFWDFGDGTSSTATNPTKVYLIPGTYNVKLRNDYGTCSDSVIKSITVLPQPVSDFTASDVTDCKVPFTVNFSDISIGATSWNWNFGDGGTSTQQNPSHTYNTLGNYTVTLIITGANGCGDTVVKPQFIRVQAPTVNINGLPAEGCVPFTISPTSTVTAVDGVASYLWNFGDGFTSTAITPSHTYTAQGNYTVKLFITTIDGCTDSAIIVNAVRAGNKSIANFIASPLSQCAGQPVQFTNLTSPSDRWLWDFGDSETSTLENPAHSFAETGVYNIRLIAWNNGCADTLVRTNYVTALPPVAKFGTTFNCSNKLQVVFSDSSTLPQTWLWNFGDGSTSTLQNPNHIYAAYGTYNVTLTVTNGSCSNTRPRTITLINESPDFSLAKDTICNSETAVFNSFGYNLLNVATFFWNFGDGNSSLGGASISHKYNIAGSYNVTLTITDTKGCVSTITKNNVIRVWGPNANFSYTINGGCVNIPVNFTDNSITDGTHPIVSWSWTFGDGASQVYTTPPFNHTYLVGNYYLPSMTVTDSYGCSNSHTPILPILVTEPQANFTVSDTNACIGSSVRFVNLSGGFLTGFVWSFGDGTTSTISNPTKNYTLDGNYEVQLIVSDVNGCRDTLTKTAYVKVRTVRPSFTVNDSISSCTPFEVVFTNTSVNLKTSRWEFGDGGISNLSNPTHYYSSPGVYRVKMFVDDLGGCLDSAFKIITVYDDTATLTYTPLAGCSPFPVTFRVSTPGPVKYLWDFSDGNTLATTDSNLIYTYLLPGNFLPKVILEDQTGCRIPIEGVDTIYITKSIVNFAADDSLFCQTAVVAFSDSTISNATVTSYNWNFGDGATSTLQNPTHTYAGPGLYTVRLIVNTINGCSDTLLKPNYIKVVADPVADIIGNTPICVNFKLDLSGVLLIPDTSAIRWNWTFGNGKTSIAQNPQAQKYDTAGSYPIRLIVTNSSACADTVDRIATIYPLPVLDAGPNQTIIVSASATINPTGSPVVDYLWTPAKGLSCTSCYNTVATPKTTTTYNIRVVDANGCISTDNITIIVICNDKNIFVPNTFSPNNDGVNDWFYPRGTGLFKIQAMRIFNRWGQMVFQKVNLTPNDPNSGWNGQFNGKLQTSDVYTYLIEIVCENNEILTYKGNITLIQ